MSDESTSLDPGWGLTAPHAVDLTPRVRLARLMLAATPSTERQSHGFVLQSGLASLLSLHIPSGYTHEVDAYGITPPEDWVTRHSIKNMKSGSALELGSLRRNATVSRDFVMYVGFWKDNGLVVSEVFVMHIRAEFWRAMFPKNIEHFEKEAAFRDSLGEISKSRRDDERWQERLNELKAEWTRDRPTGSPMNVNYKRDHQGQQRVQCSIPSLHFTNLFMSTYDPWRTVQLERVLDGQPLIVPPPLVR